MSAASTKPHLLLHACCAPCSTVPLTRLRDRYKLTLFFYGPNIHPAAEHDRRLEDLRRLCTLLEVPLIEVDYSPEDWERAVGEPHADLPDGSFGARCQACYRLRMDRTAGLAASLGADLFSVTLSVSRYKNSKVLAEVGAGASAAVGVCYLPEDFKKRDGVGLSHRLSREYGLYQQDYCGCRLSLLEAERRRKPKEIQAG
jgi:predicted adenine nucleotide alpha hydrolase (AANH) superfamily ATPase